MRSLSSKLTEKAKEIADVKAAISLMMWDQEVMMPAGGGPFRARQISTLTGLAHTQYLQDLGPLIQEEEKAALELNPHSRADLRELIRDLSLSQKLPQAHVMELSRVSSEAQQTWVLAKSKSDFSLFAPKLEELVRLKIREANYLGHGGDPYDALLDLYEPGLTAETVFSLFRHFLSPLSELLGNIAEKPQVDDSLFHKSIAKSAQLALTEKVLTHMGYDFDKGRQDLSPHPFTIHFHPQDVRITTLWVENDLREALYSSIHEGGHALYEQGLPPENYGLPSGEACSLGIHESQSRLWENNIARSLPFWEFLLPILSELDPRWVQAKDPSLYFRAVNRVSPSPIRISADELTYHFHILLRTQLEHALINQNLTVKDLPAAWNEGMKSLLGIQIPNDAQGVLQDIHWAHGSFGYFPTYSLGSFYAAQFIHSFSSQNPNLQEIISTGNWTSLTAWLRNQIHSQGRLFSAQELCKKVTGEPLNVAYFVKYASDKYRQVYGF